MLPSNFGSGLFSWRYLEVKHTKNKFSHCSLWRPSMNFSSTEKYNTIAVTKTYVEIAWCLRNKVLKFKTKLVSDNDLSASIPLPCY